MRSRRLVSRLVFPATTLMISAALPRAAIASPSVSVHIEASAARPVGDAKSEQFGWGGSAYVAPELVLARVIGIELGLGVLGLSDGSGVDPKGVAPTKGGFAVFSAVGPRIRPFATFAKGHKALAPDGFWLSGGVGGGVTGGALRPALRASIGFDAVTPIIAAAPTSGISR